MPKTAGIITIHYVDNIGGVLLAYALQESVERLGYDCRIINFDPTPIPSYASHLTKTFVRRMKRIPHYLTNLSHYSDMMAKGAFLPPRHLHGSSGVRKERFEAFRRKYIKLSEQHFTTSDALRQFPPGYDAYICGSDQVWNPFICKKPDHAKNEPAYFLSFAPEAKRVSYAPSISIPAIPEYLRSEMAELIQGIPHLSCREKQGAALIRELTGRDAQVVLDPTLLLSGDQWDRLAVEPEMREPYILCYFLGEGMAYREHARKLSEKTGLPLVVISRDHRDMEGPNTTNRSDAGPAEFLGFVKNASLICTDSFHGTIFSINFGRPFYAFERPGSGGAQSMASRIHSILEFVGLSSRLIPPGVKVEADLGVKFAQAHALLDAERKKSLDYLQNALQGASR